MKSDIVFCNRNRIKVLALIWDMGNGGAQQVVINNLRFFKNDADVDYKVIAFLPPNDSRNDKVIESEHLNVEYLGYPKSKIRIPVIRYPFNKLVEYKAWKQVIARENPDVVHVHISELLTTTLWAINRCNVSVKFDTLHSNPYRYKGYALWCIKKAFNRYGFMPLCLNELQASQAKDHYGINRYEIVHNGIDIDSIRAKRTDKSEARKRLGIPADVFALAGVGRLDPIKNYDLMLEVFAEVVRNKDKARLYIAGGGNQDELRVMAENLGIAEKVEFMGYVNNVSDIYCAVDRLLMTSHSEASPLTLIEAQLCGTKCVVSSGVPVESVISDGVSQMKAESSASDWAQEILNSEHVVKPKLTEKDYDLEASNERIKELYLKYSERVEK
nr:glycosyltransferase [uncultured Butyrivibrio sp.]